MSKTQYQELTIQAASATYPVSIGHGILNQLPEFYHSDHRHGYLLYDAKLENNAQELKTCMEQAGWRIDLQSAEASEKFKHINSVYPLFGDMLELGHNRHSTLFALGGGTIGDAAGFIASAYMRGIKWVGLPSTLLAQVDSSLGGKTGVNHDKGKNLIGAFHQPALVMSDISLLSTLSKRDYISGLGEVVKYACIFSPDFFEWLVSNWAACLDKAPELLIHIVKTCSAMKAQCIEKDEFDLKGEREVLNFGHTLGHALEKVTGYQVFHGEAVTWGMKIAVELSRAKGHLQEDQAQQIQSFLNEIPVPELPSGLPLEALLDAVKYDKKSQGKSVRFVLLKEIGQSCSDLTVTRQDMVDAVSQFLP